MSITNTIDQIISRNKEKRIIKSISKYYNGDIVEFPYTVQEIKKAEEWYKKTSIKNLDEILLHRIKMMELLVSNK